MLLYLKIVRIRCRRNFRDEVNSKIYIVTNREKLQIKKKREIELETQS